MKRDLCGVYFSSKGVTIVEQKSGALKNILSVPYPVLEGQGGVAGDDIFDVFKYNDMELLAFMQKVFRESQIEATDLVVSLPPKDLIIRFFEMPNIPRNEIEAGINFEMKKYIPFKLDELNLDFQHRLKPKNSIIDVIVCGMKQEALNRYVQLFVQLKLQVSAFEPGLFSLFRFLAVMDKDFTQHSCVVLEFDNREANILIADKGFPYFTRDIKLASGGSPARTPEEMEASLFRLINEVRVSLDYYRRQFAKREIDKMVIVASQDYVSWGDTFHKELGLGVRFVSLNERFREKAVKNEMLSDASKAFGAALRSFRPTLMTLNLSPVKEKQELAFFLSGTAGDQAEKVLQFLKDNKLIVWLGMTIGAGVVLFGYGLGFSKLFPLERELASSAVRQLPLLPGLDASSLESIQASETSLLEKERNLKSLAEKYPLIYKKFLVFPSLFPQGVWVNDLNFSSDNQSLDMTCFSYAENEKVRSDNMNKFLANLKSDKEFSQSFNSVELRSYRGVDRDGSQCLQFVVACSNKK